MTKAEAKRILRDIEVASSNELGKAIRYADSSGRRGRRIGATLGAGTGAAAGLLMSDGTPLQRILNGTLGGLAGGGLGYLLGAFSGKKDRERVYNEVKRRKDERMDKLLSQLDDRYADEMRNIISGGHQGIQTYGTDYGVFVGGKGSYSGDDKLVLKKDKDGRPVLSLLFAGINSAVEDGSKASAKSPLAERFYNRNRGRFSDVQANSVFDDPIVADAYIDKIIAKIMANRAKTGKYPKVRLVGYSAGGRGVVNFLKKMRERDPNFKADEIIGIDPYQFMWEDVPSSLRDKSNHAAGRIVYSRPADVYTGSSQKGLGRVADVVSNTAVALLGKKLRGISADTIVENHLPNVAHTDADAMYDSALEVLSRLNKPNHKKEVKK